MAAGTRESALDKALRHPVRQRFIAALWGSSEPLTAGWIVDEYLENEEKNPLGMVVYHLRVLEAAEVVKAADPPKLGVVLGGDNAGEAVRRLGLAPGGEP